jgi:ATP-dependent DNA helicase PIF1
VLSKEAAILYTAKYVTKAEKQAALFTELLQGIVSTDTHGNMSTQSACQKLPNKMVGEKAYSAQETAHLLLGIPLVCMSFNLQRLSIKPEGAAQEI